MIVGGIAIAGEVVHGESVNARRGVEREGDGRGERLPVEEEGPVLSCDEANRRRKVAGLLRIVHGDRKLPAGVVQAISLEPIALVREVVRNLDFERIYTGIDRVFALDDDIERIYRIAAHVEVGRIVLSQIYVVRQQFAFTLRFDPQESRSFGCVAGTFLLLRGYSRHFAPTVLRQEERARCLAVLIRCDRRKLGRGELTGLLILRKQRGDTCHIHHLHGLELQVVVHPVEGDVADDFGHVAPDGDRSLRRPFPDRTFRISGHGQRRVTSGYAELIVRQRLPAHRAHVFVQIGYGIHIVPAGGNGTLQYAALHVKVLRRAYALRIEEENVHVLDGPFVRGPGNRLRFFRTHPQRKAGHRLRSRNNVFFGTTDRQSEQRHN